MRSQRIRRLGWKQGWNWIVRRKKRKKSTKKEVRVRKVQFEDKGKKRKEGQEKVDELTKKLL